ncbi:MAG: SUMF1/EgtB/PvdO family nonheme iron enzyme [Phycisphaerae bacterium]
MNGDGVTELAVGAQLDDDGGQDRGAVWVLFLDGACSSGLPDCNANQIWDACDISSGMSNDCNGDGIPDECESDCNGNGVPDDCDIANCPPGDLTCVDCNGDGVPDQCQTQQSMVLVPSGEFEMGDHHNEGFFHEYPLHLVYIDAFLMNRYEVTNEQYAAGLNWALAHGGLITVAGNGAVQRASAIAPFRYCDTTSSSSTSRITWNGSAFGVVPGKEHHPMVRVSWFGAAAYANWRSEMEGLEPTYGVSDNVAWECNFTVNGYRLPTEAEWEKAARGGLSPYRRYPWGGSISGGNANYRESGDPFEQESPPGTAPVGYYNGGQTPAGPDMANGYGLYDMAGNAWEWCNDWFSTSYYSSSPYDNPRGPATGLYRVYRSGSWSNLVEEMRCARRNAYDVDGVGYDSGFRLVRSCGSGNCADCNTNGIPDECEPDCDNDGIPDDCDPGSCCPNFPDCNGNGRPDECECTQAPVIPVLPALPPICLPHETNCLPGNAVLCLPVMGNPPTCWQWQKEDEFNPGVWDDLPQSAHFDGVASPCLTIVGVTLGDAGNYRVVAANGCGVTPSNATNLALLQSICIFNQPDDIGVPGPVCVGSYNHELEVDTIGGIESVTYQWYRRQPGQSNQPIPGATGQTLLLSPIRLNDAGEYYVIAHSATCDVASRAATVSVYLLCGDLNEDGACNLTDLAKLLSRFGEPTGMTRPDGDLDCDGDVDLSDLSRLLAHFGQTCPGVGCPCS